MTNSNKRNYKFFDRQLHHLGDKLKQVSFPGFQGVPIYDVFWFFVSGVQQGSISTRASSIAFNFLLAMGPATIFLFTLIPYIPVNNLYNELIEILNSVMPQAAYSMVEQTANGLLTKRGGLQFFGLITALFFSTRGIIALMDAFNASYHTIERRPWILRTLTALLLVFILIILLTISLVLIIFSKVLLEILVEQEFLVVNLEFYMLLIGKWIIVTALIFFSISFLFYMAPFKKHGWRFINAGSTLSTLLTIVASLGFSYFVNNFAQFNKFFGSIGALMALMLWINFNALTLLIGFELNVSINNIQRNAESEEEDRISNVLK